MDNFLQLETEALYGDELDGNVDLETQIQRHISQGEGLFADQLYRPVDEELVVETDEMERQRYLHRILDIERGMKQADDEVQTRIDAMRRILALQDPMEQLSAYLALKQEPRQEDDVNIVGDLLQCAKRMTNEEDSEAALLGAFVFLCDRPRPKARGMATMLPVVAAMMEKTSGTAPSPF